ncbi:MAG: hypothetical protein Q7R72_00340 [bacterium]|nr:hypothetical protein [bacterium]
MFKESAKTLRFYFGFIGVFSLISLFTPSFGGPGLLAVLASSALSIFYFILGVIVALSAIYFSFTLPKYLNPGQVKYLKSWLVFVFFILVQLSPAGNFTEVQLSYSEIIMEAFIWCLESLFIWYLYANVSRLSNLTTLTRGDN